jgi:hypothetical protein
MEIKLNKQIRSMCAVAAIGAASMMSASAVNAASITFAEGNTIQDLNTNFFLNLTAYDLEPVTNGGQLRLEFDQSILNVASTSALGSYWNFRSSAATNNNPATGLAYVDINAYSLFAPAPGAAAVENILTIEFTAVGSGVASLDLSYGIDLWTYNTENVDLNGNTVTETVEYCIDPLVCGLTPLAHAAVTPLILGSSTVTVSAVPVPAAVWLFVSGIAGLVGVSRRKPS